MIPVLDQHVARKDQRSVEFRREQIYAMHLKGLSEREIAESVGVN
jgi:transposase